MKKAPLFLLLLVFLLVFLCSSSLALDGEYGPYSYSVKKNGDLCITHFNGHKYDDSDVYIPRMIDGYTVTEIGDSAFAAAKKNVVIIPDTVVRIGENAFSSSNITAMNIPASVKEIGYGAFRNCKKLSDFSVDKNNERYTTIDGVLYDKSKRELVSFPEAHFPSEITIPEGIKSIAPYAFFWSRIHSVKLPTTLQTIGSHAFDGAQFLSIVNFPSSITTIGEYAFADCEGVNTFNLSEASIKIISPYCFYKTQARDIILPSGLERIEEYAFTGDPERLSNLYAEVTIPNTVKYIGPYAFANAQGLTLTFEEDSTLQELAEGAFCNSPLHSSTLILPGSLIRIGDNLLGDCYLDELYIPNSVQEIGENLCDRTKTKIQAESGSYAEFWAVQNGFTLVNAEGDDTSWLND